MAGHVRGTYGVEAIDWAALKSALPVDATPADQQRRFQMFKSFDTDGTKLLSLAKLDMGIRDVLQMDAVFDCKPAIMRAYQAAKHHSGGHDRGEGFITPKEFRSFLIALHQFFDLYVIFEHIDTSGERRVSPDELARAMPHLARFGISGDPAAVFAEMDQNQGDDLILFEQFCEYALRKHLSFNAIEQEDDAEFDSA
eukprot:gnl/Spiro4/21404_TR10468_c0_g1_i1.p1 gnl/Spiro4/21404_TR10468_c0_g1~~gnl/Spiro4/21404_TR10468_c0_g1_i1.p1  ORF type:complete len:207 (-),score=67.53 gnl/Spiro4/21404_TR10468_c0_g1_i1:98-688(-)